MRMAPASPSARIAFFSASSRERKLSLRALSFSLSLFDFSCLVDGDVTFLSARIGETEKER